MINNTKIIDKMIRELELAKEKENQQDVMLKHISHVQVLCELFLENEKDESTTLDTPSFSEQEAKVMIGEKYIKQTEDRPKQTVRHDQTDGDSIFDF